MLEFCPHCLPCEMCGESCWAVSTGERERERNWCWCHTWPVTNRPSCYSRRWLTDARWSSNSSWPSSSTAASVTNTFIDSFKWQGLIWMAGRGTACFHHSCQSCLANSSQNRNKTECGKDEGIRWAGRDWMTHSNKSALLCVSPAVKPTGLGCFDALWRFKRFQRFQRFEWFEWFPPSFLSLPSPISTCDWPYRMFHTLAIFRNLKSDRAIEISGGDGVVVRLESIPHWSGFN